MILLTSGSVPSRAGRASSTTSHHGPRFYIFSEVGQMVDGSIQYTLRFDYYEFVSLTPNAKTWSSKTVMTRYISIHSYSVSDMC